MKERVLHVSLDQAIEAFVRFSWKFYQVEEHEEGGIVKIEVPRDGEQLVVEVPYGNENQKRAIVAELEGNGFFQQTIRFTKDW